MFLLSTDPASQNLLTEGSWRWLQVAQGGPKAVAGQSERHTLFLCYPPPASPMAADCLRSFRRALKALSTI